MQKETNQQSNNQEEIKKKEKEEKHLLDVDKIREIIRFIADSSYDGRYVLERHTKSLYRFGFGLVKSGDIPGMFKGKTADEAMYRAINFELAPEIKLISRDELTKLAEDQLAAIQDEQQKCKVLEEKLAATNSERKKLMIERDELTQEREAISVVIGSITDKWNDDEVTQSFEKRLASWKKRPSVLIAFLLENIEKLRHEKASRVAQPLELEDAVRKGQLLTEEVIAVVRSTRIHESIWSDMRDSVMDGEWHIFSEIDEIIMAHGYRKLKLGSIQRKRGIYLRFAKDEKYHAERGGKDYLYEWKSIEGVNKFRFTLVGEKAKPEKMVEKGLELGRVVGRIGNYPIYESPRDEFIRLFCDGKWHSFSEPVEMFKKYDSYNRYEQISLLPLRSAYMLHVRELYQKTKKREGRIYTFKFEKKRIEAVKAQNDVKCARCGKAILYGEKSHRIDNLSYCLDCYDAMELRKKGHHNF